MKVVVVSQRIDFHANRGETRDALDQRLVRFISAGGGLPISVPNTLGAHLNHWLEKVRPGMVVLSGGNDVGQYAERDATERSLLDYAKANKLPVLGICRGMQMMGVWAGASVKAVSNHVRTRHQLSGAINGDVNSFHDYALTVCPEDFSVIARSEDGEIEAIRHKHLPWQGWMWHPERETVFNPRDIEHLQTLLS